MKTIHKHRLETTADIQELKLSGNGRPLCVDFVLSDRFIYMWVEVDAESAIETPTEVRRFKVFSTGAGIPDNAVYVGSTLNQFKPEAFHVYELVD